MPTLVPSVEERPIYFVLCDYGPELGQAWAETDPAKGGPRNDSVVAHSRRVHQPGYGHGSRPDSRTMPGRESWLKLKSELQPEMKKGRPWTPEQDEELKAALLKNVSLQRLSVRFGCTADTVKLRARFLGHELPSK
jgi:hypothetical protein